MSTGNEAGQRQHASKTLRLKGKPKAQDHSLKPKARLPDTIVGVRTVRRRESGENLHMAEMHEIEYKIFGDDMQFVEVELDPGEATIAEAGGMMYMEDGVEMETIFGDGSKQQSGLLGALMGAGKRLLTGESLFMTVFLNKDSQKKRIAFGAPYPGKIVPIHLAEIGGELIAQKDSFLAAAKGVALGIAFQRKLGVGLF